MTIPHWFLPLTQRAHTLTADSLGWQQVPETSEREAAVLVLFSNGEDAGDEMGDIVIIERPAHMRDHAGQPAFPGGRIEADDKSPTDAALREAREEISLNPHTVKIIAELPQLWIPPSRFKVTPVLAWWEQPHNLNVTDQQEVGAVHRIAISRLLDPENRVRVQTRSGYLGEAFIIDHMVIWGFTGGVLSRLFDVAEWTKPWDSNRVIEIPMSVQGSQGSSPS